jgi:hypothetical protein
MKIKLSLSSTKHSGKAFVAHVKAKPNTSTSEIQEEINRLSAELKKPVLIASMPKSIRQVDKTFSLVGDIGDLVYLIAAYYDTDPDRSQLEWDWNVVFKEKT